MSPKQQFQNRGSATILERKYLHQVLSEEGKSLQQAHISAINKFGLFQSGALAQGPTIGVAYSGEMGAALTVRHKKYQRFLDMKTRNTAKGKVRKKSFPIHNKIIFGHLNNVIVKLKYGFTQSVKDTLANHPTSI